MSLLKPVAACFQKGLPVIIPVLLITFFQLTPEPAALYRRQPRFGKDLVLKMID